jgi:hypothetical protein
MLTFTTKLYASLYISGRVRAMEKPPRPEPRKCRLIVPMTPAEKQVVLELTAANRGISQAALIRDLVAQEYRRSLKGAKKTKAA